VVCFLDADDGLLPDALEKAVALMRDAPEIVKVHWPLIIIDAYGAELRRTTPPEPLPEGLSARAGNRVWAGRLCLAADQRQCLGAALFGEANADSRRGVFLRRRRVS
jgi:hypothetical protein